MADGLQTSFHQQSGAYRHRAGPKTANGASSPVAKAKNRTPATKSATGFILMDSELNPIFMNTNATEILSYPDKLVKRDYLAICTVAKIRAVVDDPGSADDLPFVTEFRSGRRHYYCRAFRVEPNSEGPSRPSIAVLLERGPSTLTSLSFVSQRFNLTDREQEALEFLLQGLSNKEIATRMNISPNTVKAFLRLIMSKMGVSSRSAIVVKVLAIWQL
jgi:DNA-binding CsgD family transcriptional regulator